MYKVVSEGKVISICDVPIYIKVKEESGSFVPAEGLEAEGISVQGLPFNLPGKQVIFRIEDGNKVIAPEAYAVRVDGGEVLVSEILSSEGRTGDILCDVDISIEDLKEAICELDEILEGGK